jgi:hypothetical protein
MEQVFVQLVDSKHLQIVLSFYFLDEVVVVSIFQLQIAFAEFHLLYFLRVDDKERTRKKKKVKRKRKDKNKKWFYLLIFLFLFQRYQEHQHNNHHQLSIYHVYLMENLHRLEFVKVEFLD